jgi:predicted transcriptional regulator
MKQLTEERFSKMEEDAKKFSNVVLECLVINNFDFRNASFLFAWCLFSVCAGGEHKSIDEVEEIFKELIKYKRKQYETAN